MTIDYEQVVNALKVSEKDISSVAIIEDKNIKYSTDNWDISSDLEEVLKIWSSMEESFITISGKKFSLLQCTDERLICTSVKGEGHIVGVKDTERIVLASVSPNGYMTTAYMATAKAIASMSSKPVDWAHKTPSEAPRPTEEEHTEISNLRQAILDELHRLKSMGRQDQEMPPPGPPLPPLPISVRSSLISEVKKVLKEGVKFEKANEGELQSREDIHKLRVAQIEKVRQALEVSKEIGEIELVFDTTFKTPYIYDDLHLLKVKHKLEKLIMQYFNIKGDLKLELSKKL